MAARRVERALDGGCIALQFAVAVESKELRVQRSGIDILLWGHHRIQVKCDWYAGPVAHGGTGNLFLQEAEVNPRRRY